MKKLWYFKRRETQPSGKVTWYFFLIALCFFKDCRVINGHLDDHVAFAMRAGCWAMLVMLVKFKYNLNLGLRDHANSLEVEKKRL